MHEPGHDRGTNAVRVRVFHAAPSPTGLEKLITYVCLEVRGPVYLAVQVHSMHVRKTHPPKPFVKGT